MKTLGYIGAFLGIKLSRKDVDDLVDDIKDAAPEV